MTRHALAVSILAAAAFAAPSAVAAPYDWTGFYIGVHTGGATGDIDWTNVDEDTQYMDLDTGDEIPLSPDGVLGGAQFGYNFDLSGWIFGVEGTFAGMDFDDLVESPFDQPGEEYVTAEVDWLGTASARLGFGMSSTLFFLKGGWAIGDVSTFHADIDDARQGSYATSETQDGWVGGVGIEHAVSSNVSVAIEYNYVDLGEQEHSGIASGPFGGDMINDIDVQFHTATARLNWRIFTP